MNTLFFQHALRHAQQLLQVGKLDEAKVICSQAIAASPNNAELLNLLGQIASRSGDHQGASRLIEKAVQASPRNHIFLSNLGAVFALEKKFEEAADCFRKAIALNNRVAELHYNLANALKDQAKFDEAIVSFRKALQLSPAYGSAWNNLGAVYIEQQKLSEAQNAINRAIAIAPNNASAYNNLANVCLHKGEIQECIKNCEKALSLRPEYPDAWRTAGCAYIGLRDFERAIACFEQNVKSQPDSVFALLELGNAHALCNSYEGVTDCLRKILGMDPDNVEALHLLAITQLERGYYDESKEAYAKAIAKSTQFSLRVRRALALQPIYESTEAINNARLELDVKIDELMQGPAVIEQPFEEKIGPNFYLAYHALNDRDIQVKIANLYLQTCPSLTYISSHCETLDRPRRKMRVGFLSKFIYDHSVAMTFGKLVEEISQDTRFDVFLISTTDHESADIKGLFKGFCGTFATIPTNLQYSRNLVSAFELDALIYLDIGMDSFSHLLAFSRLAPVQCLLGGHPVTSGIPTLDYFLSSESSEPANAEEHYSEKLVKLQEPPFSFPRPLLPTDMKSREELGLPATGNLYFCPMMLQKIHPDFDAAMSRILELDPKGFIVLCESLYHSRWGELLRARFDKSINSSCRSRVIFIPWILGRDNLLRVLHHSNIVLDPFHFGIGSTGAFALAAGTPIVTLPGEFMRGRVGLMYCNLLGLSECIAATPEDYAKRAVLIATDGQIRTAIRGKILSNNSLIFERSPGSVGLAHFIADAVAKAYKH